MTKVLAWHFVRDDGTRVQDGVRETIGKTYRAVGPLRMCENGMHASERIIDALTYASGARLRRVECWGAIERVTDKLVCRYRKPLWEIDATMILHRFALAEAARELRKAKVTDKRCWAALEVKKRWLAHKATDDELAAAWAAAGAAAWDAAGAAANKRLTAAVEREHAKEVKA